ncbi:MAG: hypothetical protein ABIT01_20085, partial [Thermoanaerobaculia bacterium]
TVLTDMATLDQREKGREYLAWMAERGGKVDHRLADGRTLLLKACARDLDGELLLLLLELGADPNATDAKGRTCRTLLGEGADESELEALRAHGAR